MIQKNTNCSGSKRLKKRKALAAKARRAGFRGVVLGNDGQANKPVQLMLFQLMMIFYSWVNDNPLDGVFSG